MNSELLLHKAEDKQRIVITGNQAHVITAMVTWTLKMFTREFDIVTNSQDNINQEFNDFHSAVLFIEDNIKPYTSLCSYHHHIAVISDIDTGGEIEANIMLFADATPKAGIIIYNDKGKVGEIGKKTRADVASIPYGIFASRAEKGEIYLVTSTDESFPIKVRGEDNLRSLSAAKEILKKIGITSGQFYKAMTTFEN